MTNDKPTQPQSQSQPTAKPPQSFRAMLLPLIAALLIGFGLMMLFMSSAYIKDVATIQRVPESVWLFVCGVPTQDPFVLPLMLTLAMVALVAAVVLIVVDKTLPTIRSRLLGK